MQAEDTRAHEQEMKAAAVLHLKSILMHPNVYRAELLTIGRARRAVHRAPKAARDGSPYFGPMVLLTFKTILCSPIPA